MKKVLRTMLCIIFAAVCVQLCSTDIYADSVGDETLGGFIEWMLDRDDLTDAQIADLENAKTMYAEYVSEGYIYPDDEEDAVSLENLEQALEILADIEDLRNDDPYYTQVYTMTTLYTNFTMMTGSAYTADISKYEVAHVSDFGSFASCEGLAWGYGSSSGSGWYSERTYLDTAISELGYSTSTLTADQLDEVMSLAYSYGEIGHYVYLFYGVAGGYDTLMGVGYSNEPVLYDNNASYNARVPDDGEALYTPSAFLKYLKAYKSTLLSNATVTLSYTSCTYNGSARKPGVTVVSSAGDTLKKNTDYTVTYSNNTDKGTAKVTIKGIGDYSGKVVEKFTIKAKSVKSASVTLSTKKYTYNGKSKKPTATVKLTVGDSKKKLTKGTDYTVTYSNNKKPGKAKVTIKGTGNYTGSVTAYYYIYPAKVTISSAASSKTKTLTVKYKKATGVSGYQIAYKKSGGSWKYVTVKSGSTLSKTISGLSSKKKYYVKVRAYKTISGKKYYGSWSSAESVKTK